jgi:nicotinamidase-related amidase
MPQQNEDLHGNVPDKADSALLMIDVLNDLEFEGGERLLKAALPMARALARLKRRAREAGIPVVYVNDNFGKWRSDFRQQLDHCLHDGVRGQPIVELLAPDENDYFVLKPKNSGFYHTTLPLLLEYLEVTTVILTGIATDNCVLYTAGDAYLRDLRVFVPEDCSAAIEADRHDAALEQMRITLKADTTPSAELDVEALAGVPRDGVEQSVG